MVIRSIIAAIAAALTAQAAFAQCSDIPAFPFGDGESARFGTAVAISADGDVALAGGPFYLQNPDGTGRAGGVRTFTNDGSGWVEGPILLGDAPPDTFGEAFGSAIAIDDAATTAIIGAQSNAEEGNFSGRVYVFERDPGVGDWVKTDEWGLPPGLSTGLAFGAGADITPDGSRVIVGSFRGAFTRDRDGAGWGPWTPMPSATPLGMFNVDYGQTVAISDDGQLAAIRGGRESFFTEGRVLIFERTGDAWTEIARVGEKGADANDSQFGSGIAFDGDTVIVNDANYEDFTATGIFGSPLFIYERTGGTYPATPVVLYPPDELMPPAAFDGRAAYLGGGIAVRGDTMYVGAPLNGEAPFRGGRAYKLERMDGEWAFTDRFGVESDVILDDGGGFGAAVDLAADGSTFIIGENRADVGGAIDVGRVHFPDRVFDNAEFEIDPFVTSIAVIIDFPGVPTQTLTVNVDGVFDLRYGVACQGDTDLVALRSATLTTTEPSYTITGPLGVPVTYSDVLVTLVEPAPGSAVRPGGDTDLGGLFKVNATQKLGLLPATPVTAEGFVAPIPAVITSGESGNAPSSLTIPEFTFVSVFDVGFGDNNPTVTVTAELAAVAPTPCNVADLAPPFGVTDLDDADAFIVAFIAADPKADLAPPAGIVDLTDVDTFITAFLAGCP